jgi:hypothetical protein
MLVSRPNLSLIIILIVILVVTGNLLTDWFIERLNFEITPANEPLVHQIIIVSMIAYTILMAVPFVPGAEIGLAVLMVLGSNIVIFVYLSTIVALSLSFVIGRFIPQKILIGFFHDIHLHKTSQMLREMEGLNSRQRLNLMLNHSPRRIMPFLLKYRYIALLLAINLPGNVVIGGGGGIAMMAGLSRLFSPGLYILTVAIAVMPIPLAVLIFGEWPL